MENNVNVAPTPQMAPVFEYQGLGKRFVALVIDSFLMFFLGGFFIGLLTGGLTDSGFSLSGLPALLLFFLVFCYFVVMEGTKGATLGKMLLGMKVVKEDGSACDFQSALTRNVLRIVDYFFFCLVGIIAILRSDKKQRVGDMIAHTVVIKNK